MHDRMQSCGERSTVHFFQSSFAVQASVSLSQWLLPFTCQMLPATHWTNTLQLIPWYVPGLCPKVPIQCSYRSLQPDESAVGNKTYVPQACSRHGQRASVSTYLSRVNMWVHGRRQLLLVQVCLAAVASILHHLGA